MPCRKLNITDFFCFKETGKIYDHEVTDLCFAEQKINAHYEYSPFGKITKTSGTLANDFAKKNNILRSFILLRKKIF